MDRFTEEMYGANRRLTEFELSEYERIAAENTCEHCHTAVDELRRCYEFNMWVCDECYDEAQALIEKEAAEKPLHASERQILAAMRKQAAGAGAAVLGEVA